LLGWLGKKWFNKKVIAVESLNRITIPSKAPKFLSKFCDEVWIPHKELEGNYNGKEKYIGFYHPFKDLIETMKELSIPKMEKRIVVGSVVKNEFEESIKGLNPISLLMRMKQTETLVTNAGVTAWEGAELCDKVIVYPLIPSSDNHQEEFAKWLSKRYKNVEVRNE
jgi:UDP-N-acetylglucosamine:LPS N-acetylglucosamine transferase